MKSLSKVKSKQQGAALVVSLVILLGVTAIAVSSMHGSSVQQKVTASYIDGDVAFQAAEAALRSAENWIVVQRANGESLGVGDAAAGVTVYGIEEFASQWWDDEASDVWDGGTEVRSADYPVSVAAQPVFVLEALGKTGGSVDATDDSGKTAFFRITSRGFGLTQHSGEPIHVTVLQSTFSIPL